MRKAEVEVGGLYLVKVSGNLARVRITGESPYGGCLPAAPSGSAAQAGVGVNTRTNREVRVRTAARLRTRLDGSGAAPKGGVA